MNCLQMTCELVTTLTRALEAIQKVRPTEQIADCPYKKAEQVLVAAITAQVQWLSSLREK